VKSAQFDRQDARVQLRDDKLYWIDGHGQKQSFTNTGVVLAPFSIKKASYERWRYKSLTGAVDGDLGGLGDLEAFC
jgi:hypothetical protein